MSRTRIVKGKYTKIVGENYLISAEGNITSNAQNEVRDHGLQNGVPYGNFERIGSDVTDDFEITLSIKKDKSYSTIVPLGILDYEENYENANFLFNYSLSLGNIDNLDFKIIKGDGTTLFAIQSIPAVILPARRFPYLVEDIYKKKPRPDPLKPLKAWDWKSVFDPYNIGSGDYTKIGSYIIMWDGFDNQKVYDSTNFKNNKLKAQIIATKNGVKKMKEVEFSTKQIGKDWVDVKIDRENKNIDISLRVNLTDGGEEGLKSYTHKELNETAEGEPNPFKGVTVTYNDWGKISNEALQYYKKPPIKKKTKTYEELRKMALDGINEYWSRTYARTSNKGTEINGEKWEIKVNATFDVKGMVAPNIIYFTNSKNTMLNRSHNWELHRELYYKIGYTSYGDWQKYDKNKIIYVTKGWLYTESQDADLKFKETSAHEIGHQLLLTYGGRDYSYSHKDTSGPTWIQQDALPGTKYPPKPQEIDLMKYADEIEPPDYYQRVVLSKEDLLSVVWLSKIKILSLLMFFSILLSCNSKKNTESSEDIVNYYSGIVLNDKKETLSDVTVTCMLENDLLQTVSTTKTGYFKITDKNLNTLNIQEPRKLIFKKEGYITDTIKTAQPVSDYRRRDREYPVNFYFIYKVPDTLVLIKQ
ncbi:hypothetical protein IV494_14640 [Kaistella sp. G5-32]|uniref:Carboxypeptidase family protein n=1 Tax=Kaistella gelatinilytica TaxID=2787636 RepID=A0ABS0FFD6_9FLAO|nr:hypothetical protein [Kaistella gelatinilytica]MBF8458418.1 hypothetical protein [Kaistella gelatinilytica]